MIRFLAYTVKFNHPDLRIRLPVYSNAGLSKYMIVGPSHNEKSRHEI